MAEISITKLMDSNKAALGRKLLNKHQKSKTARGNINSKSYKDHNDQSAEDNIPRSNNVTNFTNAESHPSGMATPIVYQTDMQTLPIQQYFNMSNTNNNFFDSDRVAIDDPELKQNEIFKLHENTSEQIEILPSQQELIDASQESLMANTILSNIPETTPIIVERTTADETTLNCDLKQQLVVDSLQSQLQQQVLTNSHLLGENSQLQGELHHSRTVISQHTDEITHLRQRTEGAEARLAETQRQLDAQSRLADEWRTTAEEQQRAVIGVSKERDVALQDASEVLERLKVAQEDGDRARDVMEQLRGQLDMANIRLQQLMTTATGNSLAECESAGIDAQRDTALLHATQLADMQVALEAVRTERDVAAQQYQLYNSQLNEQVTTLQSELLTLRSSTEQLAGRERDLVAHIGDMERLLQNQHSSQQLRDKSSGAAQDGGSVVVREELENVRQQCSQLTERLQETCAERDDALKELHTLQGQAEEIQELRNSQQADVVSNTKLLEEIRSDKVALSRAIEQNLVLKAQVAEMESAYLTLTQEKVAPLTDQLATAKHQLQGYERGLKTLQDALEVKDRELEQMRRFETQVQQLNDRLRHYEAVHDHTTPSIQQQLQHLQLDNNTLRKQLHAHAHSHHDDDDDHHHGEDDHEHGHHHHHHGDGGNADVDGGAATADREDELQQEIFQLKQQLDELRRANVELAAMQDQEEEDGKDDSVESNDADNVVTRRLSRAKAAQQLEHKFTKTMTELASLNDEKQRLEHIVLQLQSETETIGEYVALYQRQRSLLAQRTEAREAQLRHLQERLNDLAQALTDSDPLRQRQRVTDLLDEIRRSNVSDLALEQRAHEHEQHVGAVLEGSVTACGGGCAWCQGKLITV